MHVTIRRYQINPGQTALLVSKIQEEFLPIIRKAPKLIAYYAFDEGDGDVSSVSIFEDEASALASNQLASEWVMQRIASLISVPPKIYSGDVVAHHAESMSAA